MLSAGTEEDAPSDGPCPHCGEPIPSRALFCQSCGQRLTSHLGGAILAGSDAAPDPLIGQRILEYTLDRKIGEGGMGAVYLAHHQLLGQRVAVKVLHPEMARNPDIVERFLQEARIQMGLHHPNVVTVLTASTTGPHIAMVMDYVEGISLAEVLERRGPLPWAEAETLLMQVLDVVGYAHTQGVVHRDIKPSNIMITADGRALVMDFGIAKVLTAVRRTRTGTAMGSAHYMSPEQITGRRDVGAPSDIYALGITLFETLTGSVPFGAEGDDSTSSDFLVRQAQVQRDVPDPRSLNSEIPEAVSAAILKALAKAPEDRFADCGAFAAALRGVRAEAPSPQQPPVVMNAAPEANRPPEAPVRSALAQPAIAPLWRRILASLIDFLIVLGCLIPLMFVVVAALDIPSGPVILMLSAFLFTTLAVVYHAEYLRRRGYTPGKGYLGLRVVASDGSPLNGWGAWRRSLFQNLSGWISKGGLAFLDVFWALFSHKRLCLHDLVAGSIVVYPESTDS